jgi:hypothetical protein
MSWQVVEPPVLSIGSRTGGFDDALFQVRDVVMLSNGSIVVANGGASEVRWYSPTGELLHRVGREGDGPSEFRFLSKLLILPGDSVAAYDVMAQRFTTFGPDAQVVETTPIRAVPMGLIPLARLEDASYVMATGGMFRGGGSGPTRIARDTTRVYRFLDEQLDSILGLEGMEIVVGPSGGVTRTGEPAIGRTPRPFGRNSVVAGGPSGLVTGDTGSHELDFRTPSGVLRARVRWAGQPRAVMEEDLRADQGRRLSRQRNPDTRTRLRNAWEQHPDPPEYMPALAMPLLTDDQGNVWVKRYAPLAETDANTFDVIDANGVWLTTITAPAGLRVLSITRDYLLGVNTDALGVESVAVYALQK